MNSSLRILLIVRDDALATEITTVLAAAALTNVTRIGFSDLGELIGHKIVDVIILEDDAFRLRHHTLSKIDRAQPFTRCIIITPQPERDPGTIRPPGLVDFLISRREVGKLPELLEKMSKESKIRPQMAARSSLGIQSLAELPGLEPLAGIARKMNVEITAFGSLVRRLYKHEAQDNSDLPDLFKLSPLLSDIDLKHSGSPEQTPVVRDAILGQIPSAECFRWEIFSEAELAEFYADEAHLPIIPANKLHLPTLSGGGIRERWDGKGDIRSGRYRLIRNGYADRSALIRAGRDCELLYVLRFLHLLLEEEDDLELEISHQPGWEACLQIIRDCRNQRFLIMLQDHSRLRTRLRYRLKAMRSAARTSDAWQRVTESSGLDELLTYFDGEGVFGAQPISNDIARPSKEPLVSSCWIGGNIFRVKETNAAWLQQDAAELRWRDIAITHQRLEMLCPTAIPQLQSSEVLITASPVMSFALGTAACHRGQEHLHFQVPLETRMAQLCKTFGEQSLGLILLLTACARSKASSGKLKPHSCAVSLSGCCFLLPFETNKTDWKFTADEVNAEALLEHLIPHSNALSKLLWDTLPEETKQRLANSQAQPSVLQAESGNILSMLNEVLMECDLDRKEIVANIQLSPETQRLRKSSSDDDEARLNRRLLEEAYPKALRPKLGADLLLQIRVDCGHLLDVFPKLVARADVYRVADYRIQLFVLGQHEQH